MGTAILAKNAFQMKDHEEACILMQTGSKLNENKEVIEV